MMFLPKGQLRALDADDSERHNDGVQENNTPSDIYGERRSACQISNDPQGESFPDLPVCDVTSYTCSSEGTVKFIVPYTYEVTYNPQVPVPRILRFVDEAILDQLATASGVKGCPSTSGRRVLRRRRLAGFTDEEKGRVAGINLLPEDQPNDEVQSCSLPVDSATAESSECVPVLGSMEITAKLSPEEVGVLNDLPPNDKEALRSAVVKEVQRGMDEDLFLVEDNIYKVNFVELDDSPPPPPPPSGPDTGSPGGVATPQNDGGSQSPLLIGLASMAGILVAMIFLALLFISYRRRRGPSKAESLNDTAELEDPEEDDGKAGMHDKSLADKDSLALEPQDLPTAAAGVAAASLSAGSPETCDVTTPRRSPASVPRSRRHMAEAESPNAGFSQSLTSFDAAMFELDVIAEASSQETGNMPVSYQFSYDAAPALSREPSALNYCDSDDDDMFDDSESERTPRRVLQMT